uniref:Uncharacterized protein n=1 Tax=Cyanothece sp. (strain PCC 7425 / ATCC 29141) TaxID=395961 RepID=B8HVU6_CYAP4
MQVTQVLTHSILTGLTLLTFTATPGLVQAQIRLNPATGGGHGVTLLQPAQTSSSQSQSLDHRQNQTSATQPVQSVIVNRGSHHGATIEKSTTAMQGQISGTKSAN